MSMPRKPYGRTAKSKPRKAAKHPWIRYEELTKIYLPLVGGTVWGTYTTFFTYRNRKTNQCFPRYQTVAEARGLSRRTIMRHVNILVAVGLLDKIHRYYDDDRKRECGGQRSNLYWFNAYAPEDVTPSLSKMKQITRSSSNQIYTNNLNKEETPVENPCAHPRGEPLGYPHAGHWRCSVCGDLYKR
jgi:hypothetical protein